MPGPEDNATLVAIEKKIERHRIAVDTASGFLSDYAEQKDVEHIGRAFRMHEEASAMLDKLSALATEARQKIGPADQIDGLGDDNEIIDEQPADELETTGGDDGEDDVIIEDDKPLRPDQDLAVAAAVGEVEEYRETKREQQQIEGDKREAIKAAYEEQEIYKQQQAQTPDGAEAPEPPVAQPADDDEQEVVAQANDNDAWDGTLCAEVTQQISDSVNKWHERKELPIDKQEFLQQMTAQVTDKFGERLATKASAGPVLMNIDDMIYGAAEEMAEQNKPQVEEEIKEEAPLVDNGFELMASYWTKKKGKHADSKGKLTDALHKYEAKLALAQQTAGVEKLKNILELHTELENVRSVAKAVHDDMSDTWHKESRGFLDGVPFAVKQGRAAADKMWNEYCALLESKTYDDIGSEPIASIWTDFIKTPEGDAARKNHKYITGYNANDRSVEFHGWASKHHELNIDSKYYGFDINDDQAWDQIYGIAISQVNKMFGGGGGNNQTVPGWAKERARELAK